MKKRNLLFILLTVLTFTATTFFKINHHPLVESVISKLKNNSDHLQEEFSYLHIDRSFYRPGEMIWFQAYIKDSNTRTSKGVSEVLNVELYKPNGTIQDSFRLVCHSGEARGNFVLPQNKGGIYTIKAFTNWQKKTGTFFKKEIQVQQVILPNLNMTLEFEKKAYGANDDVVADLTLESLDNNPLRFSDFDFVVNIKGDEFLKAKGQTDFEGASKVIFTLPDSLSTNDVILNVMIPYRGLTESISRSAPIVLGNIELAFFPEGGDMIDGQHTFVAFEALNEFGKPADVKGLIVNDQGEVMTGFSSLHNGMGKFDFYPELNERYTARITKPEGVFEIYELPDINEKGVSLNVEVQRKDYLDVLIKKNIQSDLHLIAQAGDSIYYSRTIKADQTEKLRIPTSEFPIGICRLTVFNDAKIALCERLVFLNKHKKLSIEVKTDKEVYGPKEKVELEVLVKDENGNGVEGSFSLSASDDKLLTYADDKQGHILSKVLLEGELKGEIHEPNFYFDEEEADSDAALDLLMMTHGWRRFEWETVLQEAPFVDHDIIKERMIVSGLVFDRSNRPIPGVEIRTSSNSKKVWTDENGRYILEDIRLSSYAVRVFAKKDGVEIGRIGVQDFGTNHNIFMESKKGNFSGIMYNQNAEICTTCKFKIRDKDDQRLEYTTDKKGGFAIYNIPAGSYLVDLLGKSNEVLASKIIEIYDGKDDIQDFKFYNEKPIQSLTEHLKKEAEEELVIEPEKRLLDKIAVNGKTILPPPSFENAIADLTEISIAEDRNEAPVSSMSASLNEIVVTNYKVPMIDQDQTTSGGTITSNQIRHLPSKNISSLAASTAGLSQLDEGDGVSVKGSRPDATDYYIDGIRVSGAIIPASNIDQIQILTGGIDAKYGGGESSYDFDRAQRYANASSSKLRNPYDVDHQGDARRAADQIDNSTNIIGASSGPYYNHYWYGSRYNRPSRVLALPERAPLYAEDCVECAKEKKSNRKACHDQMIIRKLKNVLAGSNYNYLSKVKSNTINVEFVIDKRGYVGDVQMKLSDPNEARWNRNHSYYHSRALSGWKPGKNDGFKVGTRYNVQIQLKDLGTLPYRYVRQQRKFYSPNYQHYYNPKIRRDFRSTTYWNAEVKTDKKGKAKVSFWNGDDITKVNVTVEGFGENGTLGRGESAYVVNAPFTIISKAPHAVAVLDSMRLPVTLVNNTDETLIGKLAVLTPVFCQLDSNFVTDLTFKKGESRTIFLNFKITNEKFYRYYYQYIDISFESKKYYDRFRKRIKLLPRGYPHHYTFTDVNLENNFEIEIDGAYATSIQSNFKAHTSPISELANSMEKMMRQPSGCFEQTSSSNYPNIMIAQLMNKTGYSIPGMKERTTKFLERGYKRLSGFESSGGGFSPYGNSISSTRISAYGLMQFSEMAKVYPVENGIIERTANWLLKERKKESGWAPGRYYRGGRDRINAYILWAMCESGFSDKLTSEIERQYKIIENERDPYMLALMSNVLFKTEDKRAEIFLEKLIKTQSENGGWAGAENSAMFSYGRRVEVESTALALLALSRSETFRPVIEKKAQHFLLKSKSRYGYGSTQSTALTLKAIIASMDRFDDEKEQSGTIELIVDGKTVKEFQYKKYENKLLNLEDIPALSTPGKHKIAVNFKKTKKPIPFEVEVMYHSKIGQKGDGECPIRLTTNWNSEDPRVGETIRLSSKIQNVTSDSVATPLAIIGIPGGLSVQPWQLKSFQDEGLIDYYEVEDDRVVFYLDHMGPNEEKEIDLDLKVELPGVYQAPASQAYLYYNNETVSWAIADEVRIEE